ncbi:MAG: cytochrome c-type biogenesis protein CcmH [Acidimicrobiales bacterium]|nr:cytochrome c-type biogenesis protein CcmH [Acidimicrobiales bacterium]
MRSFLRSTRFRRGSWLVIVALVVVALVRNGVDERPTTNEDRVRSIASTMKCPVCRSQSVADSDVAAARAIRVEIARRVGAGESDDQIRDAIADTYGEGVQLTPRAGGLAGLVWILPVVAVVVALAALSAAFARWRRTSPTSATEADRALVDDALQHR